MINFHEPQSYGSIFRKKGRGLPNAYDSLRKELREEYKNKIDSISLEDFVERILTNCPEEYKEIFKRFIDRYLGFDKLKSL